MDALNKSVQYHFAESRKFLLNFWVILILVDIGFYIMNSLDSPHFQNVGFSLGSSQGVYPISVVGVNLMAILITIIVYNFSSNYEDFPLAISLGMTRRDYFLSFLIDNVFTSFVFALVQAILLKVDPYFVKLVNRTPLYDFKYFNIKTDNIFYIIFILFIIFFAFNAFWNLVSSINYKMGYKMWLIVLGGNVLLSFFKIEIIRDLLNAIGYMINPSLQIPQISIILATIVAFYVINYFIVIKTDIKKSLG